MLKAASGMQVTRQQRPAVGGARGAPALRRAASVRTSAAADDSAVASSSGSRVPVLEWPRDTETIKDVFAFGGSAPERVNGRMAMLGFLGTMLAEKSSKVPVLEQLGGDWFGVLLLSLTITLATLAPKFASGSSLKDLHAAATSDNLKGEGVAAALAFFDTNTELWVGRVAMIGFAGTMVLEAVTGKTLL